MEIIKLSPYNLLISALLVFIINLPFGAWRAQLKKLSFWWFVSIHLPIPFVVLIRYYFEIGFALYTYPILVFSFFSGQFTGTWLRKRNSTKKI